MSEASSFFNALYHNFLLRDLFAKMVPGAVVIATILSQNPLGERVVEIGENVGWPFVLLGAGVAWIFGFALQELGGILKIIKHYPTDPTDYSKSKKRYTLRTAFKKVATENERQQVERYAVIKEATGNGATTILLCLFIVLMRLVVAGDLVFSVSALIPGFFLLLFVGVLIRGNRSHAIKQYEFMETVVKARTDHE